MRYLQHLQFTQLYRYVASHDVYSITPPPPYRTVSQFSAPVRLSVTWSDRSDTSRGYLRESNISTRQWFTVHFALHFVCNCAFVCWHTIPLCLIFS